MSGTAVFIGAANSGYIYRMGRVGYDTENTDSGAAAYTATLKTERFSPAGIGGLAYFRRILIRCVRNGDVLVTVRAYVDDEQTTRYDSNSNEVPQDIVVTLTGGGLREDIIEADIQATGTYIQVELQLDSTDVASVFLVETVEVHGRVIRPSRSRAAESQ